MSRKKANHKHDYQDVLVHFTDKQPIWYITPLRMSQCVVCGHLKETIFLETERAEGRFHRMLRASEIAEKYKHLPQLHVSNDEYKALKKR